jgi:hypothetical protein
LGSIGIQATTVRVDPLATGNICMACGCEIPDTYIQASSNYSEKLNALGFVLSEVPPALPTSTTTSSSTTSTTIQKTGNCYRCSYPHQYCVSSAVACDDSDFYSLDSCNKYCKPGYELRGQIP